VSGGHGRDRAIARTARNGDVRVRPSGAALVIAAVLPLRDRRGDIPCVEMKRS